MSQSKATPMVNRDYTKLENGVIVTKHTCRHIIGDCKEKGVAPNYLSLLNHSLSFDSKKLYEKKLKAEEKLLNKLARKLENARKYLIVVLQGRDGAGKSSATERIIEALDFDMRLFMSVPVGPPSEDERCHPYLWRFLTGERMPKFGQVRVFDRSWAERVLVERVMKITKPKDIELSYGEIRAFEWLLVSQGGVLVKIWLDITKEEQLRRFKARAQDKPWKLSPEDTKARKHWNDYTKAANEMFYRTSCHFAPWYLISSEDKPYSRVAALEIINKALEEALQ